MSEQKTRLDRGGLYHLWQKILRRLSLKADRTELPTKTSDLANDGEDGVDAFATEEQLREATETLHKADYIYFSNDEDSTEAAIRQKLLNSGLVHGAAIPFYAETVPAGLITDHAFYGVSISGVISLTYYEGGIRNYPFLAEASGVFIWGSFWFSYSEAQSKYIIVSRFSKSYDQSIEDYIYLTDEVDSAAALRTRLLNAGLENGAGKPFFAEPVPAQIMCGYTALDGRAIQGVLHLKQHGDDATGTKEYRVMAATESDTFSPISQSTPPMMLIWGDFFFRNDEYTEGWQVRSAMSEVTAGSGGGGGDVNVIESISVNGVNVPPDAQKNVNLTIPQSLDNLGLYIDAQGYICQRIGSDT